MKSLFAVILFFIFYFGYVLFIQLLFEDDKLIEIKGQLTKKHNFVKTDTLKNKKTVKCAYLSFLMKNDKRLYVLKLDIEGVYQGYNAFAGVDKELENAGQISVWIKNSELHKIRPKVYRISTDDVTVYEIIDKPDDNNLSYLLLTLITGFLTLTYYITTYKQEILAFLRVLRLKTKIILTTSWWGEETKT
jgi:hypothetical protein